MTPQINGFSSVQVLARLISACKPLDRLFLEVNHRYRRRCDNLSSSRVGALIGAKDDFFHHLKLSKHQYLSQEKQIDATCTEEEKVRRYICLTFTPSPISVTVEGLKQRYRRQRERRRDERRAGCLTEGRGKEAERERERELYNQSQSLRPTSLSAVYLLLFTQRIRLRRGTSDVLPLSISRWVIEIPAKLRAARLHRNLQMQPLLNYTLRTQSKFLHL